MELEMKMAPMQNKKVKPVWDYVEKISAALDPLPDHEHIHNQILKMRNAKDYIWRLGNGTWFDVETDDFIIGTSPTLRMFKAWQKKTIRRTNGRTFTWYPGQSPMVPAESLRITMPLAMTRTEMRRSLEKILKTIAEEPTFKKSSLPIRARELKSWDWYQKVKKLSRDAGNKRRPDKKIADRDEAIRKHYLDLVGKDTRLSERRQQDVCAAIRRHLENDGFLFGRPLRNSTILRIAKELKSLLVDR
jgi:hypothetical protein